MLVSGYLLRLHSLCLRYGYKDANALLSLCYGYFLMLALMRYGYNLNLAREKAEAALADQVGSLRWLP